MIHTAWFVLLAVLFAGYAVLDGFDLGVGMIHLWLGRDTRERSTLIDTIGPVWNGNEVWLIAAGGSLVAVFPDVYASSFSGLYLPLMLVLWLLLIRGLGIEFRHQVDHDLWRHAWDVAFSAASVLLGLLLGVALGNVMLGVPLDEHGMFQGSFALLLNPFAVLAVTVSLAVLSWHGAAWVALKTNDPLRARARRVAAGLWWGVVALVLAMIAASVLMRPGFADHFRASPVWLLVPAVAAAALGMFRRFAARGDDRRAFLSSASAVATLLGSVAAGLYPMLLPSRPGSPHPGFDIVNAAAPEGSMRTALAVYLGGMSLVIVYLVNLYRAWRGRVTEVSH